MTQSSYGDINSILTEKHFLSGDFAGGFFLGCKLCPRKFSSTKLLRKHECGPFPEIHHKTKEFKDETNLEENVKQIEANKKPSEVNIENLFLHTLSKCKKCEKSFSSNKSLEYHMKTHVNDLPFNCQYSQNCNGMFNTVKFMWEHMLSEHNTKGKQGTPLRFKCNVCDVVGSKSRVKDHMKVHTAENNTVCPVCGKYLKDKRYLPDHLARHKGIYDYKCSECSKAYASRSSLTIHIQFKHGNKTKDHSCEECGALFYSNSHLKMHSDKHTGEKKHHCREGCDKTFRHVNVRNNHERTHRGIPEFKCTICSKLLMRRDSLRIHMMIHQGSKRYTCPICDHPYIDQKSVRKCKHSNAIKRK